MIRFSAALITVGAFFLQGCAVLPDIKDSLVGDFNQKTETGKLYQYRADMTLRIDGKAYVGMGIAPLKDRNLIRIESSVPLDRFHVDTCNRNKVFHEVNKSKSWFSSSSGMWTDYLYIPNEKEKEVPCFVYFQAFSKRSLTDWAMVAFIDGQELPAKLDCNGLGKEPFSGVSVCQTMQGRDQVIYFENDIVVHRAAASCNIFKKNMREFHMRPSPGFCEATFWADDGRIHRSLILGYEGVLVREGKDKEKP